MDKTSKESIVTSILIIFGCIACYLIASGFGQLFGGLISGVSLNSLRDASWSAGVHQEAVMMFVSLIFTFPVVFFFTKFVRGEKLSTIGFSIKNGHWADFFTGMLIGCVIISLGFVILKTAGFIVVDGYSFSLPNFLWSLLLFSCVSVSEEMMCRGFIQNTLMSCMNRFVALIVASLFFAAAHLFNPNMGVLPMVNLFLAGLLLGASYLYTRNLWLPIGLHLSWNFMQGSVFGFNVSGTEGSGIFKLSFPENNVLNGGKFGFEGSIICSIMIVIAVGLIIGWYEHKAKKTKNLILENEVL